MYSFLNSVVNIVKVVIVLFVKVSNKGMTVYKSHVEEKSSFKKFTPTTTMISVILIA